MNQETRDRLSILKKAQWDPETPGGRELRRRVSEACKGKGRHNKLRTQDRAIRTCLKCSREFMSDSKANRVCTACKNTDIWQSAG